MERKNSRKRKAMRKSLLTNGQPTCFYCGLPFHKPALPKGTPGAAKSRRFASLTLEHLEAVSLDGETIKENCVLAHGWCNVTATNLPLNEKLELKKRLSTNGGVPPWWYVVEKIIAKQTV